MLPQRALLLVELLVGYWGNRMAINIQSLFSDIIETPAQRQRRLLEEGLVQASTIPQSSGLVRTGLARDIMRDMPRQREQFATQARGMLGIEDMSPSAVAQRIIADTDPSNAESLVRGAKALSDAGLGVQAAQMRGMAADVTRQKQADLMAQQKFATGQERDIQAISESRQREQTAIENRLLAQQRKNQELTSFELEQKLDRINLEEAEIRLQQLKDGGSVDEIFGGQDILPNGTIYYASKSGDPIVKDINGTVLTGEEASAALEEGFALREEHERNIFQARRLGTESGKIAANSFEKIGTNMAMVSNLREAARLVEQGAATTELEEFLEPLNQATNFLKQVTGQLTLDQLSQVTMGALSEKELELLQATAAPSGFDKPAIIQWYKDKAAATEKALGILEKQAVYFSQPGATPGGWIEIQREERERQAQAAPGPDADEARRSALGQVLGRDIPSEAQPADADEAALEAARREILRGR